MAHKFKRGDLIICKIKGMYVTTDTEAVCKVIAAPRGSVAIRVIIVKDLLGGEDLKHEIATKIPYTVDENNFKLYKPRKKKGAK